MKNFREPIKNSKGMINIGIALGVAMVVATFMAPLGLYYLNMYNQNEKARLRTQANEVVEGLGKLIYNAYATAPLDPAASCPSASNVSLVREDVTLGGQDGGQHSDLIVLNKSKEMDGVVSGEGPQPPPGATSYDPSKVYMCIPSDRMLCQELLGRTYCVDFRKFEIAHLDENDPDSPQIAQLSVISKDPESSLWEKLRWKTAPLAAKTAQLMDNIFSDDASYKRAYAQGLESFGTTVNSPGLHSPIVTSGSFGQARLRSKRCEIGGGDPASLDPSVSNHCVSCSENAVVCVRYSLCMAPGSGVTTPASNASECDDPGQFMQGMVAMFPDRI